MGPVQVVIPTISLAKSQALLSSTGEVSTEAIGLEPGHWYGIEVVSDGSGVWRIIPLDGLSGSGVEMPVEWPPLGSVSEICLGADGPPNTAVNYDNLAITNE